MQSTPSPAKLDKAVKDAWYVCLESKWIEDGNNPPQKGELESFAKSLSNADALALLKGSKGYGGLPPSLMDDTKLINVMRSAQWK